MPSRHLFCPKTQGPKLFRLLAQKFLPCDQALTSRLTYPPQHCIYCTQEVISVLRGPVRREHDMTLLPWYCTIQRENFGYSSNPSEHCQVSTRISLKTNWPQQGPGISWFPPGSGIPLLVHLFCHEPAFPEGFILEDPIQSLYDIYYVPILFTLTFLDSIEG